MLFDVFKYVFCVTSEFHFCFFFCWIWSWVCSEIWKIGIIINSNQILSVFVTELFKWKVHLSPNGSWQQVTSKIMVKLSLCLSKHHTMEKYWGDGGIAQYILNLSTRRRWVAIFTPWSLYSWNKSPWDPLDRSLGGPQSQSGHGGEEKESHRCPSKELNPVIQPIALALRLICGANNISSKTSQANSKIVSVFILLF